MSNTLLNNPNEDALSNTNSEDIVEVSPDSPLEIEEADEIQIVSECPPNEKEVNVQCNNRPIPPSFHDLKSIVDLTTNHNTEGEDADVSGEIEHKPTPQTQRQSSYGTAFPCNQCSQSYRLYISYRSHVFAHHAGENLMKQRDFPSEKIRRTIPNTKTEGEDADLSIENEQESTPPTQRQSSYGTAFPCNQCPQSYKYYITYRCHVMKHHNGENLMRQKEFPSEQVITTPITAAASLSREHLSRESSKRRSNSEGPEADAPYVPCPYCKRQFPTQRGVAHHIGRIHKDIEVRKSGIESDNTTVPPTGEVKCKKENVQPKESTITEAFQCTHCVRKFENAEFLCKHIQLHHSTPVDMSCRICGELIDSDIGFVQHKNTCRASSSVKSEPRDNKRKEPISNNDSPFTPNSVKRALVSRDESDIYDNEISDQRQIASVQVSPKQEDYNESNEVKTESEESSMDETNSDCMIMEQDVLTPPKVPKRVTSRFSHSNNILNSSITRSSEDRIQLKSQPLSIGIVLESEKCLDQLSVVWIPALEQDILYTASQKPSQFVICIEKMDVLSLSETEKKILKKGHMFTFNILDSNNTNSYKLWTVISFETSPITNIENKLFNSFADVERIFAEYARSQRKILNNLMRYDGLFPLLSQHLKENITAFNHFR